MHFLSAGVHFDDGHLDEVLKAGNCRNSLLDEIELLRLKVIGPRLDHFAHDDVIFLANRDHILLELVELLLDGVAVFNSHCDRRFLSQRG